MEKIFEIIFGIIRHFFLKIFGRKNKEIDNIDLLVGAVIIVAIAAIIIFVFV